MRNRTNKTTTPQNESERKGNNARKKRIMEKETDEAPKSFPHDKKRAM